MAETLINDRCDRVNTMRRKQSFEAVTKFGKVVSGQDMDATIDMKRHDGSLYQRNVAGGRAAARARRGRCELAGPAAGYDCGRGFHMLLEASVTGMPVVLSFRSPKRRPGTRPVSSTASCWPPTGCGTSCRSRRRPLVCDRSMIHKKLLIYY